jgi:branched-chain amino acid transport system permease protein
LIVIIGGVATVEGPFVGVLVFFVLQEQLSDFGAGYLILLGAVAIAVMVFFPKGLWGSLAERFDLQVFPVRRRLVTMVQLAMPASAEGGVESDETGNGG